MFPAKPAGPGTGTVTSIAVTTAHGFSGVSNGDPAAPALTLSYAPRIGSVASSATPAVNADLYDSYHITALAAAITGFVMSGTPHADQTLLIKITDDGTARAIAWGSGFEASSVALPTTTVSSTLLMAFFIWNDVTSKWRLAWKA